MSVSYGHAYLTSYGWSGSGTGLRKGAIDKPIVIPPKKNLSGLGKDRDEAFPFWDHLFTAASNAIKIKVSTDDEDTEDTENPSETDPSSALRRTTTGIISNQRPIFGTPASTSGSSTPNSSDLPLSLLAAAKREAAKHSLYARFFRGPVLANDDSHASSTSSSSEPSSVSPPASEGAGERDGAGGERKKRGAEDGVETKEERRERKRLDKERKAADVTKEAERAKGGKDRGDDVERKARKRQKREVRFEESDTSSDPKKNCEQARRDGLEPGQRTRKMEEESVLSSNGQQDTRSPDNVDSTDTPNVVFRTKKKRKRKDTLS